MNYMDRSGQRNRKVAGPLVLLIISAVALATVLVPIHTVFYGTALPIALLLGSMLTGALLVAIPNPRFAIGLFLVAAFFLPFFVIPESVGPWPWTVPALITFAAFVAVVTFLHGWRMGLTPLLVGIAGSLAAPLLQPRVAAANPPTADLIVATSISIVAYFVAILLAGRIRAKRELARERESTALEQSRRVLMEERNRIARELHDVVAHSLSLIQVQASSARYRVPDLADDAARELDEIAATARGSLTEMRRLLGVLRTDGQTVELAPQESIEDIPSLVDSTRRSGVDVALELIAVTPAVPETVQIAAFRIVQESLSNAVRHAPGAVVSVHVRTEPSMLRLRVHNTAAGISSTQGAGHGLTGMRERVALLGGSLEVGADTDGGWTVNAVLRWDQDQEPNAEMERT
ncbi:sensor histidine kinase [Cryobacterium sinapicolor]|uniref:histidine kinase n=1 Tax=Cryobacterium sinapicolor TaxID=1259236 RepID=A0ABY2IWK0_9MICO|nr:MULTISPECIES: sensor histidine kinase [Cryobacterium]TFC89929.1 sensor histidine kinase [Cryobacterium sp. TMT3-29-2]TFC96395.1 sensor histidine kinase [Cryobacterium sinapicolor]